MSGNLDLYNFQLQCESVPGSESGSGFIKVNLYHESNAGSESDSKFIIFLFCLLKISLKLMMG